MLEILNLYALLFVLGVTPGPNNILLASSGMNHGYKATLPHMFGAWFAFALMQTIAYNGVHFIVDILWLQALINILGFCFIFYLSIKIIVGAKRSFNAGGSVMPALTFQRAFLLQWVNSKALMVIITFASIGVKLLPYHLYILSTMTISMTIMHIWVLFGKSLQLLLKSDLQRYIINVFLGIILMITSLFMLNIELIKGVILSFFAQ